MPFYEEARGRIYLDLSITPISLLGRARTLDSREAGERKKMREKCESPGEFGSDEN